MAKKLQSLINLAPSSFTEEEVNIAWFTNNTPNNQVEWASAHGNVADGGGSNSTWIVPPGTSEISFHIWGSGGTGAASYCCMQGLHAGAGAYAKKTLTTGFSAGDRYVMCLGSADTRTCSTAAAHLCGTAATSCGWDVTNNEFFLLRGCKGNTTHVNGPGLTNFCAEGGNPGVSIYKMVRNDNTRCLAGPNGGLGAAHAANTVIRMCDLIDRDPNDSDSSHYRTACYYGADTGARGVHACWQNGCCGSFEANCCNEAGALHWVAHPGGKWWIGDTLSTRYGFTAGTHYKNCTNESWGMFGPHGTAERQSLAGNPMSFSNYDNGGQAIGVGGFTAWTCGGTCCCGGYGGQGLVAITYKQELIWLRI